MATRSAGTLGTRLLTRDAAFNLAVAGPVAAVAVAVAMWAVLLRGVDPARFSDLGLISALPRAMILPFALLIGSFAFCLAKMPRKTWLLVTHTVALIVMIYGWRAILYDVPAFKVTWRHIGIAEVITRTGEIDPNIDAYFNWPGFFTLAGFLAKAAGFSSIEPFAAWAPVVYNLLYLAPIIVILRTVTRDPVVTWVAIWTFFLTDWVGQEYLSPQGLVFFLHLVVIAVVLRWFTRHRDAAFDAPPVRWPALLLVAVVVIAAFSIPSHQLTPFATVFALGAILLSRQLIARSLPAVVAIMTGGWVVLLATTYISGHQQQVTGGIGKLTESVDSGVRARAAGTTAAGAAVSAERLFVVNLRVATALVVWAVALVGVARLLKNRRLDRAFALVALSAFPLVGLQSYGGEIFLRVYMFALPFVAYFVAVAILPSPEGRFAPLSPYIAAGLSLVALVVFTLTRYGNERMDYFTKDEVALVDYVYSKAPPPDPPGTKNAKQKNFLVYAGSDNLPWKSQLYERCSCKLLTGQDFWVKMLGANPDPAAAAAGAARQMGFYHGKAWLILSRSESQEVDLTGISPRGSLATFKQAVERSPFFAKVRWNADGQVYRLTPAGQKWADAQ